MPWQAADAGTIAQDEQGAYHIKQGDQWIPAPKGSIAQDDAGKYHVNTDALAPPKTDTAAAPAEETAGTRLKNAGLDVVGSAAHALGTTVGVAKNIPHIFGDHQYQDPTETGNEFAKPFQHAPDSGASTIANASEIPQPVREEAARTRAGNAAALDTPAGHFVTDVAGQAGEVAQTVGTAVGGAKALGGVGSLADTAINAVNKPSAAQAETLRMTPQVTRLRADGFQISGADMDRAAGPPAPGADKAVHGSTSTDPGTLDRIQRFNQAKTTESMANDVKLSNTRAIDPNEVSQRMSDEGKVYGEVGDAIGAGRKPTATLDHELSVAAPSASDPAAAQANSALVQHYRDHFNSNGFNGPDAVQSVRDLRNEGQVGMASSDVNAQSLGRTKIGIANAIENEMMKQIPVQNQDLLSRFPEARMQLAKLHELQSVTEGGQVNANKVLQLKRSGAPLSGAADAVANASDVAPESMKRSAGTPEIAPYAPTHTGLARDAYNAIQRGMHKIPGIDQSTEAYQEAHYGPTGGENATPPATSVKPERPAPNLELKPPEGTLSRNEQPDMAMRNGELYEPVQREPTMKQSEWDRQTLDMINRYKGERPTSITGPRSTEMTGAALQNPPPGSTVRKPRVLSDGERARLKLGEAMQ